MPPSEDNVVAVVVTRHRRDLLAECLKVVAAQTRPVAHLVVVDNGPDEPAADVVRDCGIPATYLPSLRNLGGAGGFALGMLHALSLGAEYVWLADDDGRPEGPDVLATLLECMRGHRLDEVSPVVADLDDPTRLAFPLRRGVQWRRTRAELQGPEVRGDEVDGALLPGIASLFNGALFTADCLDRVGVPDHRLFVRGDEVELHRRMVRAGVRFGTCLDAAYLHPNGAEEFRPILGGRLHTQYPDDPTKRFYTYRNRGYLLAQPGLRHLLLQEWLRFGWYFLVSQRDPAGLREWLRLRRSGRHEDFARR